MLLQLLKDPQTLYEPEPRPMFNDALSTLGLCFSCCVFLCFLVCLIWCRLVETKAQERERMSLTSRSSTSFSCAMTTPSRMGDARRFLNLKPVWESEKVSFGFCWFVAQDRKEGLTYNCFCEMKAEFTSELCDVFDCRNVGLYFSSTQGMWAAPSGSIERT